MHAGLPFRTWRCPEGVARLAHTHAGAKAEVVLRDSLEARVRSGEELCVTADGRCVAE